MHVVGVLAIVAALAAVFATKLAAPSERLSAGPTPVPGPTGSASPAPVFDPSRVDDVVVGGNSWWSIEGRRLVRTSPGVIRSVSLVSLHLPVTSRPILALDTPNRLIWLVVANAVPTRMIAFDSRSLTTIATSTWLQVVQGAAAVDGYLYLASDVGVAEMSTHAMQPRVIPGLLGAVGAIAADQRHHQLIALDLSNPLGVWSYRPGAKSHQSELRLPMGKASVAVSNGAVWVGGFGTNGAMLYRLDPHTLRPVAGGRAPAFDPGAVVAAGGRSVVWVRTGDDASDLLDCLDARSGRVEQEFHLAGSGAIASTGGYAVIATGQGVLNLALDGCAG